MSKKQKILITLIIIALIVFMLMFFIVKPLLGQIKHESIRYREKFSLFERRDELKSYLKRLEADIGVVQEKSPTLQGMLLDPEKTIEFVADLEGIAAATGNWQELSVPALGPEEVKQKFPFEEYGVSLKGSFPNLIRYLVHLENVKWIVSLNSLGVSKIEAKKELPAGVSPGDVQTNLRLKVYTK